MKKITITCGFVTVFLSTCFAFVIVTVASCSFNAKDKFIPGTYDYTGKNPFRKVQQLKGKRVETDSTLLGLKTIDNMVMCKDLLFLSANKNDGDPQYFLQSYGFYFSSMEPKLRFDKEYGMTPNNSYVFFMPHPYKSWSDSVKVNIIDADGGDIYAVLNNGVLNKLPDKTISYNAKVPHVMSMITRYVYPAGKNRQWYFVGRQPKKGQSVYKATNYPDSIVVNEVLNLNLDSEIDFWGAYLGHFAFNPSKQIGVYAYNYYPQVTFINMTNGELRTIVLQGRGFDPETMYVADGLDRNIIYYRDISITQNYVYLLFLGQKWQDMEKEKEKEHALIMQYDWNGNLVKVFKTDRRGLSFCVSDDDRFMLLHSLEKGKNIYMFEFSNR